MSQSSNASQIMLNLKVWMSVLAVHGLLLIGLSKGLSASPGDEYALGASGSVQVELVPSERTIVLPPAHPTPAATTASPNAKALPSSAPASNRVASVTLPPPSTATPSQAVFLSPQVPKAEGGSTLGASVSEPAKASATGQGPAGSMPNKMEVGPTQRQDLRSLKPIHAPAPAYPALSQQLGEQGTVWLSLDVDEKGMPSHIRLKQSSGFGRLDQAALTVVRSWRFEPSEGVATGNVESIQLPVIFKFSGP